MSALSWIRYRRRALFLAGAVTVVGSILTAQSPELHRLVWAETTLLVPPARVAAKRRLPQQITADEYSPAYARRTLVPSMLGSVAVGDIDGNGESSLYIVDPAGANVLLRNTGNDRFRDITAAARVAGPGGSLSATFSDYDGSGHPSLFVAGADGLTLYHNNNNRTFSDVTQKAGLQSRPGELYTGAVLGDIDGDGFPDLLVTIYTDLNRPPSKPVFTFPNDFSGAPSRLYRNNRDGTFIDVTAASGLAGNPGRARKAISADFNGDQRLDILILRDDKPPVLYLNRGAGKFEDTTWDAGDALTRHAFFDAAATDLNHDGKPDLVLWSTQSFRALLNRGNATFEPAKSIPLLTPLLSPFGFHGTVGDLDENGFDDVLAVDNDGRLHAFANHAATFQEVAVELPPGFETSYLFPLRLKGLSRGGRLLAIQPDGRIVLLKSRE